MKPETLVEWLHRVGDWLIAMVVVSVLTSTAIGLRDRATGGAIFVSNLAAGLTSLASYSFLEKWGYGGPFVFLAGAFAGAVGIAAISVLVALRDRIIRRREEIAEKMVDRVAPGTGEAKND